MSRADEAGDDTRARLDGRRVIASLSGGKDSTAMALYLRELGVEFTPIHAWTGWESEKTRAYLLNVIFPLFGLVIVSGPMTLPELVRKKGMFPSRTRRFCTQLLKIYPTREYIRSLDDEVVNAIGVRADESAARAGLPEWEWNDEYDCETWRPLIGWSQADVFAIHRRHDVPLNPLYELGTGRVGCWPCINASKAELRLIAENDPDRIAEVRALEADAFAAAEMRIEASGEDRDPDGNIPTFFRTKVKRDGKRKSVPIAIDDAVTWSKTSRGGKQIELFAGDGGGCMRWGMCETSEDVP